eukprot:3209579-Amphidinium_carterae.1
MDTQLSCGQTTTEALANSVNHRLIPPEAHNQLGKIERHNWLVKGILVKLTDQLAASTAEDVKLILPAALHGENCSVGRQPRIQGDQGKNIMCTILANVLLAMTYTLVRGAALPGRLCAPDDPDQRGHGRTAFAWIRSGGRLLQVACGQLRRAFRQTETGNFSKKFVRILNALKLTRLEFVRMVINGHAGEVPVDPPELLSVFVGADADRRGIDRSASTREPIRYYPTACDTYSPRLPGTPSRLPSFAQRSEQSECRSCRTLPQMQSERRSLTPIPERQEDEHQARRPWTSTSSACTSVLTVTAYNAISLLEPLDHCWDGGESQTLNAARTG